eukprot:GHUV01044209.1.p1 GENE.GHUV01044209.1~~GHUV01044209.1.p1  ORF type:complete len:129 (+),score=7.57 GHUV01044209.1:100-486(+)
MLLCCPMYIARDFYPTDHTTRNAQNTSTTHSQSAINTFRIYFSMQQLETHNYCVLAGTTSHRCVYLHCQQFSSSVYIARDFYPADHSTRYSHGITVCGVGNHSHSIVAITSTIVFSLIKSPYALILSY